MPEAIVHEQLATLIRVLTASPTLREVVREHYEACSHETGDGSFCACFTRALGDLGCRSGPTGGDHAGHEWSLVGDQTVQERGSGGRRASRSADALTPPSLTGLHRPSKLSVRCVRNIDARL